MIKEKVKGFKYFKGTAKIIMVINGTRFQQGRLISTFFPQASRNLPKYAETTSNLIPLSQLPRVEMDINTDDHVTVEIPWVNTYLAFNMITQTGDQGVFDTRIYDPLVVPAGDNTVNYTIYISYHDVELTMPVIPNGFIAQAVMDIKKRSTKKNPSTMEGESERSISTSLRSIAQLASVAAKVPLLSSVAGTTSWFAGLLSNTAFSWGFSKPLTVAPTCMMVARPLAKAVNTSGHDDSVNLACFEDNAINILKGVFGTDKDEMSFSDIASRWSYFTTGVMTDSQLPGTPLFYVNLTPSNFAVSPGNQTYGGVSRPVYWVTPFTYLSSGFSYWRGGFKFKLKFVKTEFHSGRLLITFNPDSTWTSTIDINNSNYLYREIVDLRDTTEFEFCIPYVYTSPYIPRDASIGSLQIIVLNELRSASTVSSSISIIMEVAMTEDAEFASPTGTYIFTPVMGLNSEPPSLPNNSGQWVAQGLAEVGQIASKAVAQECTSSLGSSDENAAGIHVSSQYCIGEAVQSLRQLMKRNLPFMSVEEFTGYNPQDTLNLRPYGTFMQSPRDSQYGQGPFLLDHYNYWLPCFAYFAGSIRVKMYPTQTTSSHETIRAKLDLNPAVTDIVQYSTYGSNAELETAITAPAVFLQQINGSLEVQCPYYSKTHSSIVQIAYNQTGNKYAPGEAPPHVLALRSTEVNGFRKYIFTRSIGDDFSSGFWLGTPRCVQGNNSFASTNNAGGLLAW